MLEDCRSVWCGLSLAAFSLGVCASVDAAFVDEYSYTAGASLPQPPYTLRGQKGTGSAVSLDGGALKIRSNKTGTGGSLTSGYVPAVIIDSTGIGSTWSISTTFTADWYGTNRLAGAFPSLGLAIFTPDASTGGIGDGLRFVVKSESASASDYIEVGYNAESNNVVGYYSKKVPTSVPTAYTLTVARLANGEIKLTSSLAGMTDVITLRSTSTGNALAAYNYLSSPGGKAIGMYVNGQNYTRTDNSLYLTGSFDRLDVSGLNVVGVPEPTAAVATGVLGGTVLLRRRAR